jgi:hypothetical protein
MRPASDWASHDAIQIAANTSSKEFENTAVRQPPALAQRGESGSLCVPSRCC